MVSPTVLRLFVLTVLLVSTAQIYLIVRYLLWPHIQRITHCPWCWRDAGIESDFPAPWSSTMCAYHRARIRSRRQARNSYLTRPVSAALTKPDIEVPPTQKEEVLA